MLCVFVSQVQMLMVCESRADERSAIQSGLRVRFVGVVKFMKIMHQEGKGTLEGLILPPGSNLM